MEIHTALQITTILIPRLYREGRKEENPWINTLHIFLELLHFPL
jgi:hypothetical protein